VQRSFISLTGFIAMLAVLSCGGGGGNSQAPTTPTTPTPPPVVATPVTLGVTRVFPSLSFSMPVGALQAPGDASRWFVIEQAGKVRVFANQGSSATTSDFIDVGARVTCCGETGLLGMAFHPGFPADPRAYLSYTTTVGGQLVSRLAEFSSADGGLTLDPSSERVLMQINQPQKNHNGGHVVFGADGFLYFGLGDGGSAGDPHGTIGNGQDLTTLLGKMLRIDVDSTVQPYGIPADNPYVTDAACGNTGGTGSAPCAEIYAWGLRNPWQFSFDSQGGALWIADVGQDLWEEVDRITSPANLGWRCLEGAHPYNADCGSASDFTNPVAEYPHDPDESITGGFVYRGSTYPMIAGEYVCADYVSGRLFHFPADTSATSTLEMTSSGLSNINPSAFAQDTTGELYLLDYTAGGMYHLTAAGGS
jgi:glucose/arabinose dehydrogenase